MNVIIHEENDRIEWTNVKEFSVNLESGKVLIKDGDINPIYENVESVFVTE